MGQKNRLPIRLRALLVAVALGWIVGTGKSNVPSFLLPSPVGIVPTSRFGSMLNRNAWGGNCVLGEVTDQSRNFT